MARATVRFVLPFPFIMWQMRQVSWDFVWVRVFVTPCTCYTGWTQRWPQTTNKQQAANRLWCSAGSTARPICSFSM